MVRTSFRERADGARRVGEQVEGDGRVGGDAEFRKPVELHAAVRIEQLALHGRQAVKFLRVAKIESAGRSDQWCGA
jgi:hypothetical protein